MVAAGNPPPAPTPEVKAVDEAEARHGRATEDVLSLRGRIHMPAIGITAMTKGTRAAITLVLKAAAVQALVAGVDTTPNPPRPKPNSTRSSTPSTARAQNRKKSKT